MAKRTLPTWADKATRKSGCKTVRGRKAKGRAAVVQTQQLLLAAMPFLSPEDIYVKTGSAGGCDVHLSARGLKKFPFAIEVKNQESLNIHGALAQAVANAGDLTPIVFFKRSHTPMFVALRADDFLKWIY